MNKSKIVALIAVLAMPFAGFTSLACAQDSPDTPSQGALNKMVKGTYSFLADANDDGFEPSVRTFTFDGNGGLTGVMNLNDDGTVCAGMTMSGTYVVNSNRTATANMTLTSVSTSNCANAGNNDTLALSMALSGQSYGVAKIINFTEMDRYISPAFQETFDPISGVATR